MGYYSEITGLSMKYFLLLWVCSAFNASCIVPPITIPDSFNSHNECVREGYAQGLNVFQSIDLKIAEEQRLFVAFNCKPETVI